MELSERYGPTCLQSDLLRHQSGHRWDAGHACNGTNHQSIRLDFYDSDAIAVGLSELNLTRLPPRLLVLTSRSLSRSVTATCCSRKATIQPNIKGNSLWR